MQLCQLCEAHEEMALVIDLLHRFRHYTLDQLTTRARELALMAVEVHGLKPSSTVFSGLSDEDTANSGLVVLNAIREPLAGLGWKKSHFFTGVQRAAHDLVDGGTLVFVDDFVGTGSTLKRKVDWLAKKCLERGIANYRVGVIAIVAMQFANEQIAASTGWSVIGEQLLKGISEQLPPADVPAAILAMKALESRLAGRIDNRRLPSLGYQQSETLYAVERASVPNNNFPVFWWPQLINGVERETLLTRA